MLIKEWITHALERHQRRHPAAWPEPESNGERRLQGNWTMALIAEKVREVEFDAASRQLDSKGITFGEDHLPILLGLIRSARAVSAPVADGPLPSERSTAERESRSCEHCGGGGWATVFHPRYEGCQMIEIQCRDGSTRRVASRVPAHCTCKAGRWMRSRLDDKTKRQIPDLAELRGWLAEDPTEEPAVTERVLNDSPYRSR